MINQKTVGFETLDGKRMIIDAPFVIFNPENLQSLVASTVTIPSEDGTPEYSGIIKHVLVFDHRNIAEEWVRKILN